MFCGVAVPTLLLAAASQISVSGGVSSLPHIIHIVADDFGWADVGYHREGGDKDVQTPNLDALARGGIELDRFYTHKICSPSRSAIQSGRHPIHVNVQNVLPEVVNKRDRVGGYQGIPTNMTGLAAVLRRANYQTHCVGKWDVGMATEMHHPRSRGYQSWLGYFHHSNDYWKHTVEKCDGVPIKDLWRFNATYDGPALELLNGPHCSQENQEPAGEKCTYEEEVFTNEVLRIIEAHDLAQPLFLFWSLHLVHMPLQVPTKYVEKFAFIDNKYRRLNHAMANYMDEAVGVVVDALSRRGMFENSLLVFHSDNGGEILGGGICGGNNYP